MRRYSNTPSCKSKTAPLKCVKKQDSSTSCENGLKKSDVLMAPFTPPEKRKKTQNIQTAPTEIANHICTVHGKSI